MKIIIKNLTDMFIIGIIIFFTLIGCFFAGYFLISFKFYPIIYFIQGKIIKDKFLSDIENVHLKNVRQKYGRKLFIFPVIGFSMGLFGIVLTCIVAFNVYVHAISSSDRVVLLTVINLWVVSNILFLSLIPLLFLFTQASIPIRMKRSFNMRFKGFLILVVSSSLLYAYFEYKLSIFGLAFLLLISIPCIFSTWFIGQFFIVYVIRSFYQFGGWDFILNEKTSIFGRFKGFSSLVFAILAPIIAINSLLAVIYKNTSKGGFIGLWILSLPSINFNWSVTLIPPLTFTLNKSIFAMITDIIIIFLIVGPLVTFIFRPTYIFELTLNSKVYQTLVNLNWVHLKKVVTPINDTVIIHSLTEKEMRGVIIFFISFVNYIAILSVSAVTSSFHINLDPIIGLGTLNGTIELIEIPVLVFVEYLVLHDLSEVRELVYLASRGKHKYTKKDEKIPFSPKKLVPSSKEQNS